MTERLLRQEIGEKDGGRRLDEFLAERVGWLSRMGIAALVAQGACRVNGVAAPAGYRVKAGDVVEFEADRDASNSMTPEPLPLEVVYEDDSLLVVNKPAGMLVHPTRGVKSGTLANALVYHLNREQLESGTGHNAETKGAPSDVFHQRPAVRPGLVHRLDRATSGLLVVAKTQRALSILARDFGRRHVEKRYLALVHGVIAEGVRLIDAPVGRDPERHPQWGVMDNGKPAETRLRVLDTKNNLTLVELEPITGRTNQLRIHCAHIGHPIVGDEWHATGGTRLCLHAARLSFRHPEDGGWLEFSSPPPAEFAELLEGLWRGQEGV